MKIILAFLVIAALPPVIILDDTSALKRISSCTKKERKIQNGAGAQNKKKERKIWNQGKKESTDTASKKGKGKRAATALRSYENRQPMKAQTKTKLKYVSVLLILMHKHGVLENLISTGSIIQTSVVCDSKAYK